MTEKSRKDYTTSVMHTMDNRNKLGITFGISIIIHLTFLLFFALISDVGLRPVIPKVKRLLVELVEQPGEATEESPKDIKRVASKTRKVKKETAPKKLPLPMERKPSISKRETAPAVVQQKRAEVSKKPEEMQVARLKEEVEPKKLPPIAKLIPSYEQLVTPRTQKEVPRNIKEGPVVSLNTAEFKYVSYFSKLRDKIKMVWRYPEGAKNAGLQGRLMLRFVLNNDGSLRYVKVVKSSGFPILDEAAVKAIKKAAPFYAIPKKLGDNLNVVANFEYALSYYYVR